MSNFLYDATDQTKTGTRVYRYDGTTGAFQDTFVTVGAGGLYNVRDMRHGVRPRDRPERHACRPRTGHACPFRYECARSWPRAVPQESKNMTATKVRIGTADDLMTALQLTDVGTRMTVLRGIAAEPGRALALGANPDGRDVVDELLRQANQKRGQTDWLALVGALAAFSDPRVTAFFQQVFTVAENPQLVFSAAERLSREPATSLHPFLAPLLLQNDSVARARAAADLLPVFPR